MKVNTDLLVKSYNKNFKKRLKKYNLTDKQYQDMLQSQNGLCAICRSKEIKRSKTGQICALAIDHAHGSGQVRGLLCHKCNSGLGAFNDDIYILLNAINYLKKYRL